MNLGGAELLIVAVIVVLVFGAGWLPKAARNLGKAKVELDNAQKQFADTKQQVVEASGIKELESTINKANKALNTSPKNLLKGAAASAAKPAKQAEATESEAQVEDAEIVEDTNVNIDFSD